MAKVLIACEFSGTVRDAFIKEGHKAMSCDLLPSLTEGPHYQGDIRDVLDYHPDAIGDWDLIIAHPPCTVLTVAGNRWYSNRPDLQEEALAFVKLFADHPCPKIAIENPIGRLSTLWRKPDQIIQPWQYGHGASKATCLWLKGLPNLTPTEIVEVEYVTSKGGIKESRWFWESSNLSGDERRNYRNKTFSGIATAFATQWGPLL